VKVVVLLALAGCGRLGFDAVGTTGDGASAGDGAPNGDANGDATGDTGMPIDAFPQACVEALAIPVGRTGTLDTCAMLDRIDGCGPANTREIVFRFDPPATGSYTFRAFDGATQNTSNSTAVLNAACTATQNCAGVLGTTGTAGQPMYLIVEASSGGCAQIQFSIQ
jgi:hypothetical protein